jgi:hypothetical protein
MNAMASDIDELAGRGGLLRNRQRHGDAESEKQFAHGRSAFM